MNSPLPFGCEDNTWKLGTDKYETDRVAKTLKKIEHILDWQPSTFCTSAETHSWSRTAVQQPAFFGTPSGKCWNTVNGRCVAPRPSADRENGVNYGPLGHEEDDLANKRHFNEQNYLTLRSTTNAKREKLRKNTEDGGYGCGAAPIPTGQIQPFEMRNLQKTHRLHTNQNIGYCSDIRQVTCHRNLADNSNVTSYLGTNILGTCSSDSESDRCCKKYGFTLRRSLAECCDKHRSNNSNFSSDICRDSSRGVSGSSKNQLANEPLQIQLGSSTKRKSSVSRSVSSGGRGAPGAALSSEVTGARRTMEDLNQSSAHHRDIRKSTANDRDSSPNTTTSNKESKWGNPVEPDSTRQTITRNSDSKRRNKLDGRRYVVFDRDPYPDVANTTTSDKESKGENPTQPDGTRKTRARNSESKRRNKPTWDECACVPQNRPDRFVNEVRDDKRRTSKAPPEAESDVQEQVFETTVKTARESSVSEADPGQSESSTDSHGERARSLNKKRSTGQPSRDKSVKDARRSSTSDKRVRRHRVSDNEYDSPTIVSSQKSSAVAWASKDVPRNPDSEEFVTMLQTQATMICAVEAENKFLKSELISVRRTLGSLVEENAALHERLKHRMIEELLRTSEDVDRTQDMHRQGSAFVLSLASSPQACENKAALCRLLTKYDFQKVKKEFETIISLHRIKSDKMEAQLKFSRSEILRLEAEVTDLQRKLGREESFLLVGKSMKNFAVGLCVRCYSQPATVLSSVDDNSQVRQLIKEPACLRALSEGVTLASSVGCQLYRERDELMERILSTKSVCSLAMDSEAELFGQLSSFILNFETAQLEVLEALSQREVLQEELNRVVESTRCELHQERLCWRKQTEKEQVEAEERNTELVRKVEELLGELEIQNRQLSKNQREKDILQEKCESSSCRIRRIEDDYTKEIEDLKKSLCKLTQERDDTRQVVRMLEHQLILARNTNDKEVCKEPEAVDVVLGKCSSLEAHINSKVDQLQEYYGQALRDRDDVIQQQTIAIKKLKKKYGKIKCRLRQSRRKYKNSLQAEPKNQPKKPKMVEQDKSRSSTVQNAASADLKTELDFKRLS